MKKYPKYKPSGVEWIGEVPEHWEVEKLKFWVSLVNEKEEDTSIFDFKISLDIIEKFTGKLLSSEATFEGLGNKFQAGDVLFNKLRPYLAKAILAEKDGIAVSELLILRPLNISGRFLLYRVLAMDFLNIVDGSTNGAKMPRANWDFIGNLKLAKPPLPEQTAIAAYLDRKTAQIDQTIAEKEKLIELFREERQAIINHAVTKGIRPGVKMKNSGVEWIGEVPEGWEVKKLKYLGQIKYGLGQPPPQKEGGIPLIRATNIERGKIVEKDLICVDPNEVPYERDPVLKTGDIIIVRSGAYTADSAIIPSKFEGAITGYDMVFRAKNCEPKYIAYALLSHSILEKQLLPQTLRAAQPHLNREELGETIFVLPSDRSEQIAIITHIDRKTTQIDDAISGIQQEIALLQEYRQALIFEAVTGKIDVREYAQN